MNISPAVIGNSKAKEITPIVNFVQQVCGATKDELIIIGQTD